MEQKHARAAQNIVRTHPPFSKMTWRLRNCPGITTSYRTDTNRDLTLHSSEQKTGSSELWNLMTSGIVCCLATLGSNKLTWKVLTIILNSSLREVPNLKSASNSAAYGISLTARSAVARHQGRWEIAIESKWEI